MAGRGRCYRHSIVKCQGHSQHFRTQTRPGPERSCPAPSTAIRLGAGAAEGNSHLAWPGQRPSQGFLFIHSRTHSFSHPPIHSPIHSSFSPFLRPLCLLFPSYFPVFFPLPFPSLSPQLCLLLPLCLSAPLASPTTFLTHSPIFSWRRMTRLGFED